MVWDVGQTEIEKEQFGDEYKISVRNRFQKRSNTKRKFGEKKKNNKRKLHEWASA
jgi:hypothetical protein